LLQASFMVMPIELRQNSRRGCILLFDTTLELSSFLHVEGGWVDATKGYQGRRSEGCLGTWSNNTTLGWIMLIIFTRSEYSIIHHPPSLVDDCCSLREDYTDRHRGRLTHAYAHAIMADATL
jgi:hypothetical protein